MASTLGGSGINGNGSQLGDLTNETQFTDLRWTVQTQTDALVAPSDSPAVDTSRLVEDASGNRVLWTYRQSTATWKGVQVA